LALTFTKGNDFVAGSVKRLIFEAINSSGAGAEYASRKYGVDVVELERNLAGTLPPKLLKWISMCGAATTNPHQGDARSVNSSRGCRKTRLRHRRT
jgi:hypothetical protein